MTFTGVYRRTRASIAATFGTLILATAASAGEPAVPGYADYAAYQVAVKSIAKSKLATLESLGTTKGGRDVFLLTIGTGKTGEKPALLVVGNVHPPHLLGSELATRLARRIVDDASKNADARKMFDRVTIYVIPRPSPDASEAFFERPLAERSLNRRPIDDDGDGQVDEDGPDDLNGDGLITMIRVEDTTARYIPHPDDDRVMIAADPEKHEAGRWALYVEGRDNDQDDKLNEDPSGGVDFNRNFTFRYPYFGAGAGPHQVSEVETRAVADFAFSHPNIAAVLSFSPEDNLMKVPKADESAEKKKIKTTLLSDDVPSLKLAAEKYGEILDAEDAPDSPDGEGSFTDWAYFHYGRWSLACRGWWIPEIEAEDEDDDEDEDEDGEDDDDDEDERGADELNALAWFDEQSIDGFVDWQPIEHPDFPDRKVEVGGFKPFLRTNPPADQLEPLAEKHCRFVRELVELFPRLEISELKAEPLGSGVWRVTAAVVNRGRLPSMSKMGRTSRQLQGLQMQITLSGGASLVTGYPRVGISPLSPDGGRQEKSWLVTAPSDKPASARVRVWSPSAGSQVKSIKLEGR